MSLKLVWYTRRPKTNHGEKHSWFDANDGKVIRPKTGQQTHKPATIDSTRRQTTTNGEDSSLRGSSVDLVLPRAQGRPPQPRTPCPPHERNIYVTTITIITFYYSNHHTVNQVLLYFSNCQKLVFQCSHILPEDEQYLIDRSKSIL